MYREASFPSANRVTAYVYPSEYAECPTSDELLRTVPSLGFLNWQAVTAFLRKEASLDELLADGESSGREACDAVI